MPPGEKNPQANSLQHKQGRASSPSRKDSACHQDSVVSRQPPVLHSFRVCLLWSVSLPTISPFLSQSQLRGREAWTWQRGGGILTLKRTVQSSHPSWSCWVRPDLQFIFFVINVTSPTISRVFMTNAHLVLQFPSQPLLSENLT